MEWNANLQFYLNGSWIELASEHIHKLPF